MVGAQTTNNNQLKSATATETATMTATTMRMERKATAAASEARRRRRQHSGSVASGSVAVTHSCRLAEFFLNARTLEKRTTKTSCEGTKNSCGRLTLGKIIFGFATRVVVPPQQAVSNATMEQVKRWGEGVSDDGLDVFYGH